MPKQKAPSPTQRKRIAIIGAGASGLVTARFLVKHGAQITIYEQHSSLGGQWDTNSPYSGVWPTMRTNTCSITTYFSDMPHENGIPLYPRNQTILSYLEQYAERYGLTDNIRFNTRVTLLERSRKDDCWRMSTIENELKETTEEFDAVVVASGRFNEPFYVHLEGQESFSGDVGLTHAFRYKHPERYRDKRVVVCGSSISAFEISTSLVMEGAKQVVTSFRKPKYLVGRLYKGVSAEYFKHTRYERMLSEIIGKKETHKRLVEFALKSMGAPAQYNAPQPTEPLEEAPLSTSETFLPLVAEGHITPRPWPSRISGKTVHFDDGSVEHDVDGIIMCTGYRLKLPFLSAKLCKTIQPTRKHIPLAWYSFHPDIESLAFIGYWHHSGSVFLSTEQQARFIAYVLCGVVPPPSRKVIQKKFKDYMADPKKHGVAFLNVCAFEFATHGHFMPDMYEHPELARYLLFGPVTPPIFRLDGVDAFSDAPQRIIESAAQFGVMTSGCFSEQEKDKLHALAKQKNDPEFTRFVTRAIRATS